MAKTLMVTGGSGFIGGHVLAAGVAAGWSVVNADRFEAAPLAGVEFREFDLTDEAAVGALVTAVAPQAIIHCAAIGDVDQSQNNPPVAWRVNVNGTANMAAAAASAGAHFVFLSTSTIFDGVAGNYKEEDLPNPVNVYGRTKVAAEQAVRVLHPPAMIVRVSMAYGYPRTGGASFLTRVEEALRAGKASNQPADEARTPIDVLTCADALVELAGLGTGGVLNLGPQEHISRYDFGVKVAQRLGLDTGLIKGEPAQAIPGRAPRPKDVDFDTTRARELLRTPLLDTSAGLDRVMAGRG